MFLEEIIFFRKAGGVGHSGKSNGLEVRAMGFNSNFSMCSFNFSLSSLNCKISRGQTV